MAPYEGVAVPESEHIEQNAAELEARFRWAPAAPNSVPARGEAALRSCLCRLFQSGSADVEPQHNTHSRAKHA